MNDVTHVLAAMDAGDPQAARQLLPLVYDELRKLAAARMGREPTGVSLNATGLVHEAYLRLVGNQQFQNRGHFFAAAAEAMRRILVDHARNKARQKRGGGQQRLELEDYAAPTPDDRLLALNEALTLLAAENEDVARVVELRYFGGLNHDQISAILGITVYEVRQQWTYARAWLQNEIEH